MSSKKVEWDIGPDGKGTKTTTHERDDGSKSITVQAARENLLGFRSATNILSEEERSAPK
ncbi:MAG TPA: hypothetical protein VIB55_21025 [Longimicrobium sp.]